MGTLSETTMQSLKVDASNSNLGNQYIAHSIQSENRNGKLVENNKYGLELNGKTIVATITKPESLYELNPIEYIKSRLNSMESSSINGDFWRAIAMNKNGTICFKLEYIGGEHQQDIKGIEQNKLPYIVDIQKVDRGTIENFSRIDFTTGIDKFTNGIKSGECSGSHLDKEHVNRVTLICDNYNANDRIKDIFIETKIENGEEKQYYLILRESGLTTVHNVNFYEKYVNSQTNRQEEYALKPNTMFYMHPSRLMFYEKMSEPQFKDTLKDNISNENPQEQIFYFSREDLSLSYYPDIEMILDVPEQELEDGQSAEYYFMGDIISARMANIYEESIQNGYDKI